METCDCCTSSAVLETLRHCLATGLATECADCDPVVEIAAAGFAVPAGAWMKVEIHGDEKPLDSEDTARRNAPFSRNGCMETCNPSIDNLVYYIASRALRKLFGHWNSHLKQKDSGSVVQLAENSDGTGTFEHLELAAHWSGVGTYYEPCSIRFRIWRRKSRCWSWS